MPRNAYPGFALVRGLEFRFVQLLMFVQLWYLAWRRYRRFGAATRALRQLLTHGDHVLAGNKLSKGFRLGRKYGWDMFHPLWPSPAFNRFFERHYAELDPNDQSWPLRRLLIALTKRCPLQCAHCSEWDTLNQPDQLTREELQAKIQGMVDRGVSQLVYSGGEPLSRWSDLLFLLNEFRGQSQWIYSSGYGLTLSKARKLKAAGLEGIALSLDHHVPDWHNAFRGNEHSYHWVKQAVAHAQEVGLLVSVNVCPTREYLATQPMEAFMDLMQQWQVATVNVLEPRAVGHFAGQDVNLGEEEKHYLKELFFRYNFDPAYRDYPSLTYPGLTRAHLPCGGGRSYLLLDYDGTLRPCPFCKKPLSLAEPVAERCEAPDQRVKASSAGVILQSD